MATSMVVAGSLALSPVAVRAGLVQGARARPATGTLVARSRAVTASAFKGTQLKASVFQTRAASKRSGPVRMAVEPEAEDPTEVLKESARKVADWWDKQEDKLAVASLGAAGVVALWAASGLVNSVDKIPLVSNFFEFVGILFSGWFTYRYLLFKPDREELLQKVEDVKSKITGQ